MPTKVIGGSNAVRRAAQDLSVLGSRALIITGSHSAQRSGALDDVIAVLRRQNIGCNIYSGVTQNPLMSQCISAGHIARECQAEFLIAIGGGSVMDAGKVACIFASNPDLTAETVYDLDFPYTPLPLVTVGLTAGTGSEVSPYAVITVDATGRKRSITHACCYPRIAIADALYTRTMSYAVTVSTALDALSHILEGWLSPRFDHTSALFAVHALSLVWDGLVALANGGERMALSYDLRDALYTGSICAGMVLNTCSTGFPHALGYPLTERYGVPHGQACALFLPALLERGREFIPERTAEIYRTIGADHTEFCAVLHKLIRLPALTPDPDLFEDCRARWQSVKNFANSPGGFTADEGVDLLRTLAFRDPPVAP